jgi:hypothetical protein
MPRGVVAPTSIKGLPEEIRAEALQPEESLGTRWDAYITGYSTG